jgi:hypothetical protein
MLETSYLKAGWPAGLSALANAPRRVEGVSEKFQMRASRVAPHEPMPKRAA